MGQEPARTMREIDEIRQRIDAELDELGEALPPVETIRRKAALAAVGGATTLLTLWFLVHRLRIRLQDRRVRRLVREAIEEANETRRPDETRDAKGPAPARPASEA